ncbi:MAG: aminotransferase class IV [Planctomycetota bacterium]
MTASRQAYWNGTWIDEAELSIPIADPGFTMGVTITERLRTFGGKVWRQAEHVARLRRSAEIVGIDESIVDEIDAAIPEFVARHKPQREADDDWAVVAFATPGVGGEPTRCVHGLPLPFGTWASLYADGVRVVISEHREPPANCWPTELKCRSRMHYYLADRQAAAREAGARAILLDQDGYIAEATIANVVIYSEAEGIVSPKLEKVLPGISVNVLRELAIAEGISFVERDLTPEAFRAADEVWLTSTSTCLLPVVRCDGQPIGTGRPGVGFARMLAAWNDAVGLDIAGQAVQRAARG